MVQGCAASAIHEDLGKYSICKLYCEVLAGRDHGFAPSRQLFSFLFVPNRPNLLIFRLKSAVARDVSTIQYNSANLTLLGLVIRDVIVRWTASQEAVLSGSRCFNAIVPIGKNGG